IVTDEMPPSKDAAVDMQAPPYAIIYSRPGEHVERFERRAINAVNSSAPFIIIAFRDPVVFIRDAHGTEVRALRGGMPWESGTIPIEDIASEGYLSYINYVREFVRGFRRHVRCCLADTTSVSAQDVVRTGRLPDALPPNFAKASALATFVFALLLPLSAFAQTVEQVLGRRAAEVPPKNSEVSVFTDKKVYTVIADGVRNYIDLLRTRLGGLSWPTDVRMVVVNDHIIAKAPSVEDTRQAVRSGAAHK
ncbi:MAG: hypothetical protein NZM43_13800, partial [Saprospiraceae bacterium]|nr:hypothetical protein [Saprospiraceae bacterium]MDW8485389.1 hypothetical protein [Saprospiraceae bacterium]